MFDLLNLGGNSWKDEAAQSQGCVSPSHSLFGLDRLSRGPSHSDSEPRVRVHRPSCGEASSSALSSWRVRRHVPSRFPTEQSRGHDEQHQWVPRRSLSVCISVFSHRDVQVSNKMAHVMILLSFWAYLCWFSCDH